MVERRQERGRWRGRGRGGGRGHGRGGGRGGLQGQRMQQIMPAFPPTTLASVGELAEKVPTSNLCKIMFPAFKEQQDLIAAMELLQEDRFDYVVARFTKDNPAVTEIKQRSYELLARIRTFQAEQKIRVEHLERKLLATECSLAYHQLYWDGRLPGGQFYTGEKLKPKWERDDDDDQVLRVNWATFNRFDADEIMYETRERYNYEAVMSGRIDEAMRNYISRAKLRRQELARWEEKVEIVERLKTKRLTMPAAFHIALCFIERSMEERRQKEKAKAEILIPDDRMQDELAEQMDKAVLDESFAPLPYTHNPQHPGLPLKIATNPGSPEFCTHCKKFGHNHVNCKELYADEEDPNFCSFCNKDGHHRNECWELRPELKEEHKREQEKKKSKCCEMCRRTGKAMQFCYKVHGPNSAESNVGFKLKPSLPVVNQIDNAGLDVKSDPAIAVSSANNPVANINASPLAIVREADPVSQILNSSWDDYEEQYYANLAAPNSVPTPAINDVKDWNNFATTGNLTAINRFASANDLVSTPPVNTFDLPLTFKVEKYCHVCKVYGHRDMDCTRPVVVKVEVSRPEPKKMRASAFAKAIR